MKNSVCLWILTIFVIASSQSYGQETGLFNGNGIKNAWGAGAGSSTKSDSSVFGFHKGTRNDDILKKPSLKFPKLELPKFEMPKLKAPKWEMPKLFKGDNFPAPVHMSDTKGAGLFSGMPKFDLMPDRDPNQPNFFQRMNDRTKEMFGKTKDGFSNLASNTRDAEKSAKGTWDKITRGVNGDIGGSGNRNQPPVQPNLRTARDTLDAKSRF